MMDLDEMKQKWAEQDRKLDESIRLNRELVNVAKLNGARSALQRMTVFLGMGAAVWFVITGALGSFIYDHIGNPALAVPAALLDLYAIGMLAATLRQIVAARSIDYGKPVAAIQPMLEALRILRIRTTQWALLGGMVVWAPFVIVAFSALTGVATYGAAWLWTNVAFGLALIPVTLWVSRKYADRLDGSPFIQRLMNDIAGHNLNAAAAFIGRLSEFQGEPAAKA